ncbi:collagen triplehelix repeat-containing protein [Haloferula helveola]|uniref:Collagen triplehelix repeat-containing protein n=1 Tax=Haloferula helveola TaxID=490095 RepID=A0ABM7RAA9_9BACT|nr:collagen triplehelix repeat-containing protein [Haloferula helveola]
MNPLRTACFFLLSASACFAADPPPILSHQGRISVGSTNWSALGYFKFALVDAAGTATYWSNDGTGTGGGEPTAAVEVVVANGHYGVGLGDASIANMTAIPASVFSDNDDVRLRVWFGQMATGPFELLTPDRRITSTGYALNATTAQSVPDASITLGKLDLGGASGQVLTTDGSAASWADLLDNDAGNEVNTSLVLNGTTLELTDAGGTLSQDLASLLGNDWGSLTGVPAGFADGVDDVEDGDTDDTNELQSWSTLPGIPGGFADNIDDVDDADASTTNEIQDLSLAGDTLSISGGGTSADLSQYFLGDGSESYSGTLTAIGGGVRVDNNVAFSAKDSAGTYREMLKKSVNDETQLATATGENIIFKDGSNVNMTITGNNGYVGVGEATPLARLHIRGSDTGYSASDTADVYIEDQDAGLSLLSTQASSLGSYLNFVEVDSGTGKQTDRWTLERETTGGTGDSSIRLEYFDGAVTEAVSFATNGDATFGGDLKLGSAKAGKLQIPSSAFSPTLASFAFYNGDWISPFGNDTIAFVAPVFLPNGCTVTAVRFHLFDDAPDDFTNFDGALRKRVADEVTTTLLAELTGATTSSAAPSITTRSDITITDPVITSEAAYSISVEMTFNTTSSFGLRFYGATIEYQYDTVTP